MTPFALFMAGDVVGIVTASAAYLAWPHVERAVRQVKMLFGRAEFVAKCGAQPKAAVGQIIELTWQDMLEALPSDRVKLCMADYQKNITKAKKSKKKHSHWRDKLNRCQAELLRREAYLNALKGGDNV